MLGVKEVMSTFKHFINNKYINLNCPYCKAKTSNYILQIEREDNTQKDYGVFFFSARCTVCKKATIYFEENKWCSAGDGHVGEVEVLKQKRIYPVEIIGSDLPEPSKSMPEDVKAIYNEAASVFDLSLRSSGALIRVALEKLLKRHVLNDPSGRLYDMIGRLSPNQPEYIIQLMDIIRTSGNSSAHDGLSTDESIRELNDNENRERVITLFKFLNLICELIGLSNQSNKMFSSELTEGQRNQIKIRNQKNKED